MEALSDAFRASRADTLGLIPASRPGTREVSGQLSMVRAGSHVVEVVGPRHPPPEMRDAGLKRRAARTLRIPTGGWMPKRFETED
jgi:hypothetical protein